MNEIEIKLSESLRVLGAVVNGVANAAKPLLKAEKGTGWKGDYCDFTYANEKNPKHIITIRKYKDPNFSPVFVNKISNRIQEKLSEDKHVYGDTNIIFNEYDFKYLNNPEAVGLVTDTRFINGMKAILKFKNGLIKEIETFPNQYFKRRYTYKVFNKIPVLVSIHTVSLLSNTPKITLIWGGDFYKIKDITNKCIIAEYKSYKDFPVDELKMHVFMALNNNTFNVEYLNFSPEELMLITLK